MTKHLLLAAIAVLALTGCPEKTETSKGTIDTSANNVVSAGARAKIKAELKGVKKACQSFNAVKGTWPADMQELVDANQWKESDRADPWGNDFVIVVEENSVTVHTFGMDGEEGGEGRDTDYSSN